IMQILFTHTNFPGQFGPFGAWLAERGWDVLFATGREDAQPPARCRMFHFPCGQAAAETHRHAHGLDRALRTAEAFAIVAKRVRERGIVPDVVVAHGGWGAGTYAKAVWPETCFVTYAEWWYRHPRADVHPAEPPPRDPVAERARALAANAPMLLDLAQADLILCPTTFQATQFPAWLRARLLVDPDGVDTDLFAPDPTARGRLATYGVPADAEVVTYATRGMEPYRGFPEFLRALALLQQSRPCLHAVIAGRDRVVYGAALPPGESWKQRMLAELELDATRTHFVDLLPLPAYADLLRASDLHVYLTLPFVLSWSMLEAMSIGCPLVASDVAPVREAVGTSGAAELVDHHDVEALAATIARGLDDRPAALARGARARARILEAYDRAWLWPARADRLRRWAEMRRAASGAPEDATAPD
ncbi:MAG: glycosyltransferase, partial [Pseudomonadota bacterium]